MMKNTKGQGMSTNTIILLILGVIILVLLIWGFMTGWSSFKFLINSSNVDGVIQECSAACSINSVYSFCSGERTLNVNEDKVNVKSTCAVFSSEASFDKYKVSDCPAIDCELSCGDIVIDGRRGTEITATQVQPDSYDVSSLVKDMDPLKRCIIPKN